MLPSNSWEVLRGCAQVPRVQRLLESCTHQKAHPHLRAPKSESACHNLGPDLLHAIPTLTAHWKASIPNRIRRFGKTKGCSTGNKLSCTTLSIVSDT